MTKIDKFIPKTNFTHLNFIKNPMSFHKRLTFILEKNDIKAPVLVENAGVTRKTVGFYKSGKSAPNVNFLVSLKLLIPSLDFNWLLFGQGEPYLSEEKMKELLTDEKYLENIIFDSGDMSYKSKYVSISEKYADLLLEHDRLEEELKKVKEELKRSKIKLKEDKS